MSLLRCRYYDQFIPVLYKKKLVVVGKSNASLFKKYPKDCNITWYADVHLWKYIYLELCVIAGYAHAMCDRNSNGNEPALPSSFEWGPKSRWCHRSFSSVDPRTRVGRRSTPRRSHLLPAIVAYDSKTHQQNNDTAATLLDTCTCYINKMH